MGAMILVIGATGHVGGALATRLAGSGVPVRALVRDTRAALPDGVEPIRGDLTDPAGVRDAATGVDAVFLVWPFPTADLAQPVVDALAERTGRIVYLSSSGVADGATDPINRSHAELERMIRTSGPEWTFLRSGGMATNTLGWAGQIRESGVVRWVYGGARRALIHEADLAEVAALAVTTDDHVGTTPVLTGADVRSQRDQVAAIGAAIGRPVRWVELERADAKAALTSGGWPAATADGALDAWERMTREPEPVSATFEQLTGHRPHTFDEWALDHASAFR